MHTNHIRIRQVKRQDIRSLIVARFKAVGTDLGLGGGAKKNLRNFFLITLSYRCCTLVNM